MLFNWIKRKFSAQPQPLTRAEPSDRDGLSASRDLTPERCDDIMRRANVGDSSDQCRLAAEILEKNWDVFHAVQTRRNAILGVDWRVEDAKGDEVEDGVAQELETAGVDGLLHCLADALMPGFGVAEILWGAGGSLAGFQPIQQRHFTFMHGPDSTDVFAPLLVASNGAAPLPLDPERFLVHRHMPHGGDPARGGLIRPLAWLHCFANAGAKNMLGFVERHGMPFLVARLDQPAWEKDRTVIQNLIRNFGPSGGGVFSKSVELELLESNNVGEVYWKLLAYMGDAITKVVLGQTATAGDGGGLSKDNAQGDVRQDLLEADCKAIEATMTRLLALWTRWNGGPPLRFAMQYEPPEDGKAAAEEQKARYDAMGSAITAGVLTPTSDIEASVREKLGLPPMPPEAVAYWKSTQGVRRPTTLQSDGTGGAGAAQALGRLWRADKVTDRQMLAMLAAIGGMDLPRDLAADPFPAFARALSGEVEDDASLERLLSLLQSAPETLLDRFGDDTSAIADWLASETVAATETAAREQETTNPTNSTKGEQA